MLFWGSKYVCLWVKFSTVKNNFFLTSFHFVLQKFWTDFEKLITLRLKTMSIRKFTPSFLEFHMIMCLLILLVYRMVPNQVKLIKIIFWFQNPILLQEIRLTTQNHQQQPDNLNRNNKNIHPSTNTFE